MLPRIAFSDTEAFESFLQLSESSQEFSESSQESLNPFKSPLNLLKTFKMLPRIAFSDTEPAFTLGRGSKVLPRIAFSRTEPVFTRVLLLSMLKRALCFEQQGLYFAIGSRKSFAIYSIMCCAG